MEGNPHRTRRRTSSKKARERAANLCNELKINLNLNSDAFESDDASILHQLPPELLSEILHLISYEDVLVLSSVEKGIRAAVHRDDYFWKAHTLKQFKYLCLKIPKNRESEVIEPSYSAWFSIFLALRKVDRTANIFMRLNTEVRRLQHLACKKMQREQTEHVGTDLKFAVKREVQSFLVNATEIQEKTNCMQCYFVHPLFTVCPFCASKTIGQSCEHSTQMCRQFCRPCGFLSEFMSCALCQNVSLIKRAVFFCSDCNRTICQKCQPKCEKCQNQYVCGYCNTYKICNDCRENCSFCDAVVENPNLCGWCGAKACKICFDNGQLSEICEVCTKDFCETCYVSHLPCNDNYDDD